MILCPEFQTQKSHAYNLAKDLIRRTANAIEPYIQTVSYSFEFFTIFSGYSNLNRLFIDK